MRSVQEFVPGKGLVSVTESPPREDPARQPAVSGSSGSSPYWSPATKLPKSVGVVPRPPAAYGARVWQEPLGAFQGGSRDWQYSGDGEQFTQPAETSGSFEQEDVNWGLTGSTMPMPPKRSLQTIGIPEPIRQHFRSLDLDCLKQMPPDDPRYKEIPPRYTCAYPLDDQSANRRAGGSFGYASAVYRVTDNTDSNLYALRRIDNVRTSSTILQNALSKWVSVRHPSIVSLYSIQGDKGTVFFTHAYHPSAQTLKQRFIDQRGAPLTEELLWRILTQLLAGIRAAHAHGVAVRVLGISRILLVSGTRIRINCVGVPDVLEFESRRGLAELQADDLLKLGIVMLALAARSQITSSVINQAMSMVQVQFSPSFYQLLDVLLTGRAGSVAAVCAMVPAERWCDELDLSLAASDGLHAHLRSEYECSRLLRLCLKLGMINERPEKTIAGARDWSETGDRYILKLFRDYLFHQTQLDGTVPSVDGGHIISSLNKLDAADPERILLSSRNNKDLLVVSFSDVHRCLEEAFSELVGVAEQARMTAAAEARRGGDVYPGGAAAPLATPAGPGVGRDMSGQYPPTAAYGGVPESRYYFEPPGRGRGGYAPPPAPGQGGMGYGMYQQSSNW